MATATGPRLADALSLLAEMTDELVVATARDTHAAWARRSHGAVRRVTGRAGVVPEAVHGAIATAVYGGIGAGLRATSAGLDRAASAGLGPVWEQGPRARFVASAVNGLIGDRLVAERPRLAIPVALRDDGRDVAPTSAALAAAHPEATGRLVVFVHGLCENESYWRLHAERTGTTYPEALAAHGWTPLLVRLNTGLGLRESGAGLAGLLQQVVEAWPVPVTRIALVGHSMGGLVARAAVAVGVEPAAGAERWTELVSDLVTLGTPHLGAPIARGIGHGVRGLDVLPETAAFGRILDRRSVGVRDLVDGLGDDVAPLPRARHRLVSATLSRSPRSPVGHVLGDLLVRPGSAVGRAPGGRTLFPDADLLHVGGTDHFGLLNHPEVLRALERWLDEPAG
ncbi:esterase/lipase family protein [Nocardioides sambongensis]|uniref:esterase/lipase family protein n=1 Tax=Nocardioides sambongensis TaxID=2589074 RepID=UPI001126A851|nr:alpha/beta fold hydrolase [Nocardioides sambongensis]